jgi:dimethylglycine dehydrogenase
MTMPDRATVVVIGGGIMGASAVYHLAHEGWTDVLLLEKAEPTSGSTWHAAGQITHSVSSYTLAAMRRYGTQLYARLQDETGVATSWHRTGSFRVAYTPEEVDWLRGQLGVADYAGNAMSWVAPEVIARQQPFYDVSQMLGAVWTPEDGHVDPSGATHALLAGARALGARIRQRTRVLAIERRRDGDLDVRTDAGTVVCAHIVNAAGCYADRVAAMVGLRVPMANALHTYLVTADVAAIAALEHELPVIRDDYVSGYIRQEQRAGLIGIYEQVDAEAAWHDGPAWELEHPLFPADFDRIGHWLERAFERMPVLEPVGIRQVIRGAITHTPDGEALLGPSGVPGFWMACGAQVGIADGPGLGRELARWMVHGETALSVRGYDPRRFGFIPDDGQEYGRIKGVEDYEYRHQTPLPGLERPALRPLHPSSLHDRLADRGAVFTQVYGWERPKWFPGAAGLPQHDRIGFRRVDWFEPVREECRAVRERVGIMELSAFAKFELHGPDAAAVLDRLTTNRLPRVGRIGLTYLLTPTGRLEGEMTVTRLADDGFYLVSAAVGEGKDLQYLSTHIPAGADVQLDVVSRDLGVLVVAGPRSRDLLARCTAAPLDNDAFGWLSVRDIVVCGVAVRALRVGFTGELGWELHVPADRMLAVYDDLTVAGADLGLADVGNHALNSLRMEKAYRTSRDLTHDVDPVEAGLGFFVKRDKGDFVGRDALLARDARPRRWASAYLAIDAADADCIGGEGVYDGGRAVGLVSSGGYGYTTGVSHAFAWVDPDRARPGTRLDVAIVGERRPARVLAEPAYDPKNERLKM